MEIDDEHDAAAATAAADVAPAAPQPQQPVVDVFFLYDPCRARETVAEAMRNSLKIAHNGADSINTMLTFVPTVAAMARAPAPPPSSAADPFDLTRDDTGVPADRVLTYVKSTNFVHSAPPVPLPETCAPVKLHFSVAENVACEKKQTKGEKDSCISSMSRTLLRVHMCRRSASRRAKRSRRRKTIARSRKRRWSWRLECWRSTAAAGATS
jgi:hypothetical protein